MTHYPDYLDGQLDPQAETLLTQIARANAPSTAALSVGDARAKFLAPGWLGAVHPHVSIGDVRVDNGTTPLRLRLYTPQGTAPFPVLLFFHGGGFVLGAVEEFDPLCSRLAAGTGAVVVSVDYRLAPEHVCPAAIDDAEAATRWLAHEGASIGVNVNRAAVMGDSAGGHLAIAAARVARDEQLFPLRLQVLVCPWVDLDDCSTPSFRMFGGGRWLSAETIDWHRRHFLVDLARARDPRVSPLLAENLAGLAPALILNAEFDVLRDQVTEYARRLRHAGVAVDYRLCHGMLHDFLILPGLFDRASGAEAEICRQLRHALEFGGRNASRYSDEELDTLARGQYEHGDAGFPLVSEKTALVMIDMQEEFAADTGGPYRVPEAARRIPTMARLLHAFRERALPVIHTAFANTHHFLDRPRHGAAMPNRAAACRFDEAALFQEPRFVPALEPRASEVIIRKPSYGAFFDTPLQTVLQRLGVDTIVLAGTLTDCCIGATARQGFERGFGVVVASDATATALPEMHEAELKILRRAFARVLPVEGILRELGTARDVVVEM